MTVVGAGSPVAADDPNVRASLHHVPWHISGLFPLSPAQLRAWADVHLEIDDDDAVRAASGLVHERDFVEDYASVRSRMSGRLLLEMDGIADTRQTYFAGRFRVCQLPAEAVYRPDFHELTDGVCRRVGAKFRSSIDAFVEDRLRRDEGER